LTPINRSIEVARLVYDNLTVDLDRELAMATVTIKAPSEAPPADIAGIEAQGVNFWPFAMTRDLEDAIMELRVNEKDVGTWVFKTEGEPAYVEAADKALLDNAEHWLVREITLFMKRTFKRVDVSSRSLVALIEPGSCFTGSLLELVIAADRSFMLDGGFEGSNEPDATVVLTGMNFGPLVMPNGLTRLEHRFLSDPSMVDIAMENIGKPLEAVDADEIGLVTFIPDDIDWEDEVRIAIEERASFSPDALTGMEASLRFAGPETLETKIFGRLSAWQNWIFQRPNAAGDEGALRVYGSGQKASFNKQRV
jgi:benzoyl-CoA-dihydrodiol lyase